jgi:hypothetical protein
MGKPIENAQITKIPAEQMFLLAGCDEIWEERIAQRLWAKTWQFLFLFFETLRFCLNIY